MLTLHSKLWPVVEASVHEDMRLADADAALLPKELVHKFLAELALPFPGAFAVMRSELVTALSNMGDMSSSTGKARTHGLKDIISAGAAGFQLLVGTPQSPAQIIGWLGQYRYRIAAEQAVAVGELFDDMFPSDAVALALQRFSSSGGGALVGFAHDANPIWIVGQPPQ
jgi:hypothetical protein